MGVLASLAGSAGIQIIEQILSRKLGDAGGQLAGQVLAEIAKRAGVPVDQLEQAAQDNPGQVIDAMRETEKASPELIALYASGLQLQMAQIEAEKGEPLWMRAWRPGLMYLIGLLWLWNVIILHVLNAIFKTALPPMPFDQLIQLSGLYMGLYMGGHTVKDAVAKWMGAKA
ncbi:hypothetical protein RHVG_00027 [Rhodovulum phage RS1]|uniref:hypothetical protein n=1 Tax=Rhodobacter phage RC1 TaxID=754055 RepID=UPI0002C189F8|nr:hypothetical protein RHWG_00029 [Rhodobacter phage RC1]YP_007676406.1 hypothetical protein RHVG_00027 [Rhodovulum phage RS1]AGH57992.1 hypothetical protein RHVG_00027 [Rhodovulum phage RS1]AGH58050.1 hypothetical protein RHWG_00029 [Rhodobacter phage RC1]